MAARGPFSKGGDCKLVLRRKPKKRYLSIMHQGKDTDALDSLARRCAELFGQMTLEKAGMRQMRSVEGVIVVRCRLDQLHAVIVAIALCDPPMVLLDMAGNIGRLMKRLPMQQF